MFLLGLAIAIASVPGWTSISIPAGWAAMSIFLPLTLWRGVQLTPLHILFLCFLGWAALSLAWTPDYRDGGFRLWQLTLVYLAFRLGSSLDRIDPIIAGLATGCVISSALAVAQHFGFPYIMTYSLTGEAPGLFFNHSLAGQTLALVAIACLMFGLWYHLPLLLPGIYLSGSRGGWLVLAVGGALCYIRWPKLLILAILGLILWVTTSSHSADLERLLIWKAAALNLSWLGQGAGSFTHLWITTGDAIRHPIEVHNDLLQLLFEFGLVAGILVAIVSICLTRSRSDEWPVLAAFVFLGAFAFPLFTPISTFLGALCAGRLAADWNRHRLGLSNSRHPILSRPHPQESRASALGREAVSLVTGTTK